jgi:hypothetical protein
MGAMSQLYADTQDHREQIDTLRQELQMAAARFNALAKNEPAGPFGISTPAGLMKPAKPRRGCDGPSA